MYCSISVLVIFVILASEINLVLSLDEIFEKCKKEAGVKNHLKLIDDGDFEALTKDPISMCYEACYLREMKLVNAEGYVNLETFTSGYSPVDEVTLEALKSCTNPKADNFCERAVMTEMCLEANPVKLDKAPTKNYHSE